MTKEQVVIISEKQLVLCVKNYKTSCKDESLLLLQFALIKNVNENMLNAVRPRFRVTL